MCDAAPFDDTRRVLEERAGRACRPACSSRTATRRGPPTRRAALQGARSLVVGALGYAGRRCRPRRRAAHGRVARYATDDHYARLRDGLHQMAEVLRRIGAPGEGPGRRQRAGRPGRGGPCRDRLVRQERERAGGRARQLVRARLGADRRRAGRSTRTGGRRMRGVHPLHRSVPDRRDHRAGCRRRPPLPGMARAAEGRAAARVPRGARRSTVRVRRVPGGVPPVASRGVQGGRRRAAGPCPRGRACPGSAGSTCSGCSAPTTTP